MADLSSFPITKKWPAKDPSVIQLYSLPTPNGVKVSIALEELGLPYEAHLVSFGTNEQKSPEFVSLNPNGRIPAILDPNGPDGKPIGVFESGAILIYLAEKTGKLLPKDAAGRYAVLQWLMFQMGGVGPMFGQFGHFYKYAADKVANNPYPTERYRDETRRLLGVLEGELATRPWLAGGEYTIADIATFPWVRGLKVGYEAADVIGLENYPKVMEWVARAESRPASQKGLNIPPRP
ncbi:glutathione binding-like protein [Rhizobium sp. S95]|uniref:Glutathione binding-like protein n=1 Tax=Ciceribacter sichuanensis TaxID=2949647 RepID=A0AAJ1BS26_9HYPH|nr:MULTISPECIES: glutathione binding-like protein [unclassified Ciceribacter]MCM2394864.1 glutathione binding-like protein [Ciceribacter sp. S95]MCM2403022.1 glutathione binding-like protein [Ciceribacter sp. S153]MCO5955285.1 glutathione binding-like protein [Ciceribacter sp. S101]